MSYHVWMEAARLRTLPASFVPVLTGASLAWHDGLFRAPATLTALACAVLIQVGTNFANDYFDFIKGADRTDRVGFQRASATGSIAPKRMLSAALGSFSLAFLLGLYLVWLSGWPIFVIGILSITAGVLYTGGPFPLAYNGLGDLFVFLFFGVAAVSGTYYVNALSWSIPSLWASVAVGALSVMILVTNNYRDVHTDRRAGKNTLVVLLGERFARWQYLVLALIAFAIPPHFHIRESYDATVLLPMLLLPWAMFLVMRFWRESDKHRFNAILVRTAQLMTLFGILFCGGILLSSAGV